MNPEPLTSGAWADTGWTIKLLWICLGLALTGATSLLTAHAFIPSATDSGTLPTGLRKLRPMFYATGVFALAGIVVAVVFATDFAGYVDDVYSRRFR